jgi:multisubunit Na+/H+ antiporter MnhF subunit
MNVWLAASIALLPPLACSAGLAMRGSEEHRLVAVQFAGVISVLLLALLSMAYAQPSFLDLALALALVNVPGTLIYTQFLERWL